MTGSPPAQKRKVVTALWCVAGAVLVLAPGAWGAAASFVVEKAAFSIIEPENLKGSFDSAIGDFGGGAEGEWPAYPDARAAHVTPPCSTSLLLTFPLPMIFIVKVKWKLSKNRKRESVGARIPVPLYGAKLVGEVVYDAMNALGCELFVDLPKATGVGHSTVVLIDRGDCFFVEKAWHAQLAGANAIIVADNVDEGLLTMANPGGDDGTQAALAEKITIPSALVTKSVGDALKQARVNPHF
jgi:hypothetical protein